MPAWPSTLPAYVQEGGYQERFQDQKLESSMDTGPAKLRRRFTKQIRFIGVQMLMTESQVTDFEAFYFTTLKGGVLPFDWVHPRTRSATTFRFRNPSPTYGVTGGVNVLVNFTLEVV
jgi:hypothetical protein